MNACVVKLMCMKLRVQKDGCVGLWCLGLIGGCVATCSLKGLIGGCVATCSLKGLIGGCVATCSLKGLMTLWMGE